MKRVLLVVTIIALFAICFTGCTTEETASSGTSIKSLSFSASTIKEKTLKLEGSIINTSYSNWVNVSPSSFNEEDIEFISANPEIAIVTSGTKTVGALWFEIASVSEGETVVYAQTKDGSIKSQEIKVKVTK